MRRYFKFVMKARKPVHVLMDAEVFCAENHTVATRVGLRLQLNDQLFGRDPPGKKVPSQPLMISRLERVDNSLATQFRPTLSQMPLQSRGPRPVNPAVDDQAHLAV